MARSAVNMTFTDGGLGIVTGPLGGTKTQLMLGISASGTPGTVIPVSCGGAATRLLADAWAWDRKTPVTDICPLVAVTLAAWAHKLKAPLADVGVWVL